MRIYEEFVKETMKQVMIGTNLTENDITFTEDTVNHEKENDRICIALTSTIVSKNIVQEMAIHSYELYEAYLSGAPLDKIVSAIIAAVQDFYENKQGAIIELTQNIGTYESAKPHLFVRPINISEMKGDDQTIARIMGDIALVLYYQVDHTDEGLSSIRMKKATVESWGCLVEEVFNEALVNTYIMNPPRLYDYHKILHNPLYQGMNFMNILDDCTDEITGICSCLSTPQRVNGAMSIFLPGVAERLGSIMNNDYFIVFTSKHECMIHLCDTVEEDVVRTIMNDTIDEATPDEDVLTRKLYRYDYKAKEIICIG